MFVVVFVVVVVVVVVIVVVIVIGIVIGIDAVVPKASAMPLILFRYSLIACAVATASTLPASAEFVMPSDVPVDRLIRNLSAYIREHPKDAQGYYVLARVHSLAYAQRRTTLRVFEPSKNDQDHLPNVDHPFHHTHEDEGDNARRRAPPSPDALREHLRSALVNFEKAIALAPDRAHYHLGLAFTLEAGAADATDAPPHLPAPDPLPADEKADVQAQIAALRDDRFDVRNAAIRKLRAKGPRAVPLLRAARESSPPDVRVEIAGLVRASWEELAIASSLKAHSLASAADLTVTYQPFLGLQSLVSYEAGRQYLRLVAARGPTDADRADVARVTANLKTLHDKPELGIVTPVIFPVDAHRPLDDLLGDPDDTVAFDLDGTGRPARWPWVRPDTGVLAWDPHGTGRVASGRQLFGSVTWWMFWDDGYRALDALDDDRDGGLGGTELRGLAVWQDGNVNGTSEAGEVKPLDAFGIDRIATRATGAVGPSPFHPAGLRLRDGRTLPTYDWVVVRPAARP